MVCEPRLHPDLCVWGYRARLVGSILQLLPYHSCAAVACHARMQVVAEDGDTITDAYEICRGW